MDKWWEVKVSAGRGLEKGKRCEKGYNKEFRGRREVIGATKGK